MHCRLCSKAFFPASLEIHVKQCAKKMALVPVSLFLFFLPTLNQPSVLRSEYGRLSWLHSFFLAFVRPECRFRASTAALSTRTATWRPTTSDANPRSKPKESSPAASLATTLAVAVVAAARWSGRPRGAVKVLGEVSTLPFPPARAATAGAPRGAAGTAAAAAAAVG